MARPAIVARARNPINFKLFVMECERFAAFTVFYDNRLSTLSILSVNALFNMV